MATLRCAARMCALGLVLMAMASTASAAPIFTFGFTELSGDFDSGTSTFTASAVDTVKLKSAGDVTRTVPAEGTADYNDGFVSGLDSSDFLMEMLLSDILATSAKVAPGDGSFIITDADGDTITGDVVGTWTLHSFGFMVFSGDLANVALHDNGTLDGMFDGPDGGQFSLDFSPDFTEPFVGSTVSLVAPTGTFFDNGDFAGADTLIQAQILPEPVTLALMVFGSGAALLLRSRSK